MYQKLEQKVILGGLSNSTLLNYGRCIAKISLHFNIPVIDLEEEQINRYLQFLLTGNQTSRSYFKHTVYGLRLLYPSKGINLNQCPKCKTGTLEYLSDFDPVRGPPVSCFNRSS